MASPIKWDLDRASNLPKQMQTKMKQATKRESLMYEMGPKSDAPSVKDHAPKQGISPKGDLGLLGMKEMRAMFPRPIKHANAEWASSQHLPMGKPRIKPEPGVMYKGMACGTSIYGANDLKDYSGMKAGKKPAKQRRGVTAKDHGMTNDKGYRNPSYGMGGNYVG